MLIIKNNYNLRNDIVIIKIYHALNNKHTFLSSPIISSSVKALFNDIA